MYCQCVVMRPLDRHRGCCDGEGAAVACACRPDATNVLARAALPQGHGGSGIDLEQRYGIDRSNARRALDELVARRVVRPVLESMATMYRNLAPDRVADLVELRAILEGSMAEA